MPRLRIFPCLAVMTGLSLSPAGAEPSFPCGGTLNAAERTICDDVLLGDLDRRMATVFYATRDRSAAKAARKLSADQGIWLSWRNTCGTDGSCLRRRYEQRIIDLMGEDGVPPGFGGIGPGSASESAAEPVTRRIRDGRYELIYPDGTIRWQSVGGGSMGTEYPDGTANVASFSQAPPPSFPSLPGGYSDWGAALETNLLSAVDSLLLPSDRAAYRALNDSMPYSNRVLRHVQAINFLLRE